MNEWVMKKGRLWRRVIYLPNSPWHNWYGYPLPGGPSSYLAAMLVMLGSHHKTQWLALPLHETHRKSVICSTWQFLWCKYPNHGQFQATLVMSLNLTSQRKPAPAHHCTWVSSRLGANILCQSEHIYITSSDLLCFHSETPASPCRYWLKWCRSKHFRGGTSLVVQWLRLQALNAGGSEFDPWSKN